MNFEEDELKEKDEDADFNGAEPDELDDEFLDEADLPVPGEDEFSEGDPDEEEGLAGDELL